MQPVSESNFGPLIAYLVPGATALWGVAQFSPFVKSLFEITPANAPTISGFLYLTVASVALGMTVSAARWALIDSVHRYTGLKPPNLNFSRLAGKVDAMSLLIEIHYRHYQFYANMFVAALFSYLCVRMTRTNDWSMDLIWFALETVFFLTSRDTLRKYHGRTRQLLGTSPCRDCGV